MTSRPARWRVYSHVPRVTTPAGQSGGRGFPSPVARSATQIALRQSPGRSAGVREVIIFPSRTTAASTPSASVLPMQHPAPNHPWVLEICPASIVQREGLPTSYKGSAGGSSRAARETILGTLVRTGRLVVESGTLRTLILDDPGGDALDSVIAAYAVARALLDPAGLATEARDYRIEGYVYV